MKSGVIKQQVSGLQFSRQGFSRQGFSRQELLPQHNAQHGGIPPRVDGEALHEESKFTPLDAQAYATVPSIPLEPTKRTPVVRISDPVQALLQLLALIVVMIAIGYYIVVYKPGVPSQGVRAISAAQQVRDNEESGFFSSLFR